MFDPGLSMWLLFVMALKLLLFRASECTKQQEYLTSFLDMAIRISVLHTVV